MISKKSGDVIMIRMSDGEDFFANLERVVREHEIRSGIFLSALGMLKNVRLNFLTYPEETGKYVSKDFEGPFELVSLMGDIGFFKEDTISHIHVVLSDKECNCIGGHLDGATVNATIEAFILVTDMKFERREDTRTGLKLIHFED
jgi:predicted DNA-binding protein with PD1-like motif